MTAITDPANIEHVTLSTPDIGCDHCVATIQETLSVLDGISSARASTETKSVDVVFDAEVISLGKIEAALEEVGYPVTR
ncbi:MAG TPA: heavy-metal-associated domain-containing protein [Thermomicrobiales bacterium]|nr:heavy-metal-associated domain-containing protein [Thermomicrobiales bacterium]